MYRTTDKYRGKNVRANDAFARKIMRPELLVSVNALLVNAIRHGDMEERNETESNKKCMATRMLGPECVRDWIDLYRMFSKHGVFFLSSRPERRTCFFLFNYEHLPDNGPRTSCCIEMCINRMRVSSFHSFFRWLRFISIRYLIGLITLAFYPIWFRSELWQGVRSLWLGWWILDESLSFATIFIQWIQLISAAHFSELSFSGSSPRRQWTFASNMVSNPIDFSGLPYFSWIINEANSELVLNWLLQQWKPS